MRSNSQRLVVAITSLLWPLLSLATQSDDYMREAQSYFNKHEYHAAEIQLKNVLLTEPENGSARLLLGKAYLRQGDWPSAEKELSRALNLGVSREQVLKPL